MKNKKNDPIGDGGDMDAVVYVVVRGTVVVEAWASQAAHVSRFP